MFLHWHVKVVITRPDHMTSCRCIVRCETIVRSEVTDSLISPPSAYRTPSSIEARTISYATLMQSNRSILHLKVCPSSITTLPLYGAVSPGSTPSPSFFANPCSFNNASISSAAHKMMIHFPLLRPPHRRKLNLLA